jgi:hypothetical protein
LKNVKDIFAANFFSFQKQITNFLRNAFLVEERGGGEFLEIWRKHFVFGGKFHPNAKKKKKKKMEYPAPIFSIFTKRN